VRRVEDIFWRLGKVGNLIVGLWMASSAEDYSLLKRDTDLV
jgi:hypothetical protein